MTCVSRFPRRLALVLVVFAAVLPPCSPALSAPKAKAKAKANAKAKARPKAKKKPAKAPAKKATFSDAAVARAIEKAKAFLWSKQKPDGSWEGFGGHHAYPDGPTALAVYALMAGGESPNDERMLKALDWLAKQQTDKTYCLGLRCQAWVMANKETDNRYRAVLRNDLRKIIYGSIRGGYGYDCIVSTRPRNGRTDNSNSQYGVLGAWAAALAGEEIPNAYWNLVLEYWKRCQCKDGGWGYQARPGASRSTMVAAGIATLFVCFDNLLYSRFSRCKVDMDLSHIERGLAWMDKNFTTSFSGIDVHYYLYGIERVGLACGYKYFGTADWYKIGAVKLLGSQAANGSWKGGRKDVVSTSFALLFLVRGQHAIAFNKLEFKGDWNNRPRDLAQLTRWLSGALERTLNWQVINLKVPVEQWHDAPILYLSASDKPDFSEADLKKIRRFLHQGGTIFSAVECGGAGFRNGIREVYKQILPAYELKPVPRDHPLYHVHYKLPGYPNFHMIHNGVRPLVLHTDRDLPKPWQLYQASAYKANFQISSNMLMYVTDMGQLRNRGVSHWPARPTRKPVATAKIARVRHAGNWNPEPAAFQRFGMLLQQRTGVRPEVEVVAAEGLGDCDAPLACLTGTDKPDFTQPQLQAIKQYVDGGGMLFVDAAGGSPEFHDAVKEDLQNLFGVTVVRRLSTSSPMYTLKGNEIESASYRRKAKFLLGSITRPELRGIEINGRLAVVLSREDVTAGLLGTPMYDCAGYTPESAYEIMRNAVLLSLGKSRPPKGAGAKTAAGRSG